MGTKDKPGAFDCYAKAEPDEPMFVLLGRDPLASLLVSVWADVRERMGGTEPEMLEEARQCAVKMQEYCRDLGKGEKQEQALMALLEETVPETRSALETLAHVVEARARRHECMGADCAVCYPNEISSRLREIASGRSRA